MIGSTLGSYRFTDKLGEGGMGEVWRATDSRLKREVAIKVLPAAFVADAERLARFEREAQLLAQLNHPNIAQIYGLEASGDLVVAAGAAGFWGQGLLDSRPPGPASSSCVYFASAASIVSRSSGASGVTLLLKNFTTLPSLSTTYLAKFQVGSEPVLPRCE